MMARIKNQGGSRSLGRLTAALFSAIFLTALAAVILSREPLAALRAFFLVPFLSNSAFFSMLELSAPLALCALGVVVSFRAGHYSLGGEGQAYAGAMAAASVGYFGFLGLGPAATITALLAGVLAGAMVAALPAAGRRFAGADVLLTSILVSQGVIFTVDWVIGGPLRDTTSNLVGMPLLNAGVLLPRLAPPSTLTVAPFLAVVLCLMGWFFFERTRSGEIHDLYGKNPLFTLLQGYDCRRLSWMPIVVAGMLHGMAGAVLALGAQGTAIRGMSGGIGWSAIGVALVAGSNPLAIPLSAFLFSWLDSGARQASVLADLPPDAGQAIKAVVILLISAKPSIRAFKELLRRGVHS
jgi:simple sugar transport system permease protein